MDFLLCHESNDPINSSQSLFRDHPQPNRQKQTIAPIHFRISLSILSWPIGAELAELECSSRCAYGRHGDLGYINISHSSTWQWFLDEWGILHSTFDQNGGSVVTNYQL